MKRKYNIILLFFIMFITIFLVPMKAQAAPNPSLWHWIGSNDEFGFFVSTRTPTRYFNGVKQWVMRVKADDSYDVALEGFRWNNGKESALIKVTYYDRNGNVVDTINFSYIDWHEAIPGTYGESIWDYVSSQVRRM